MAYLATIRKPQPRPVMLEAGFVKFPTIMLGAARAQRGMGDIGDPTLDLTDFTDPIDIGSSLPTTFSPIGAGTMQPVFEPVQTGITAPVDYAGPGVISSAEDAAGYQIILQPAGTPMPAGAVATDSNGNYVNAAGQIVGAAGAAAKAAVQIYSAAQLGRPALTAAQIAQGAVGYNAAGQLVNALGQPIGGISSLLSSPYVLLGIAALVFVMVAKK